MEECQDMNKSGIKGTSPSKIPKLTKLESLTKINPAKILAAGLNLFNKIKK